MKSIINIGLCFYLCIAACQSNSNFHIQENVSTKSEDLIVPSEAIIYKDGITQEIHIAYQSVKDALVADDFVAALEKNKSLILALKNKKGCETTVSVAEKMNEAKDIKDFRNTFTMLNVELVPFLKHQSLSAGKVYEQYCPMANNGEGGSWISNANKVRNPYYGVEMFDCGNVVDSVEK